MVDWQQLTDTDTLLTRGTPSPLSLPPGWCVSSQRPLLPALYPRSPSVCLHTDWPLNWGVNVRLFGSVPTRQAHGCYVDHAEDTGQRFNFGWAISSKVYLFLPVCARVSDERVLRSRDLLALNRCSAWWKSWWWAKIHSLLQVYKAAKWAEHGTPNPVSSLEKIGIDQISCRRVITTGCRTENPLSCELQSWQNDPGGGYVPLRRYTPYSHESI